MINKKYDQDGNCVCTRTKFFEPNLGCALTNAKAGASSGGACAKFAISDYKYNAWQSIGSNDITPENFNVILAKPTKINRLFIRDHNLKDFSVSVEGANLYQEQVNLGSNYWQKEGVTFDTATLALLSQLREVYRIIPDAVAGNHCITTLEPVCAINPSGEYTFEVFLRRGSYNDVTIEMFSESGGVENIEASIALDLIAGTASTVAGTISNLTIAPSTGFWFKVNFDFVHSQVVENIKTRICIENGIVGDPPRGVYIFAPSLKSLQTLTLSNICDIDGNMLSSISYSDYDKNTSYFEFDDIEVTQLRIDANTTQVADQEKCIGSVILTNEIGSFETYPKTGAVRVSRNFKRKQTIGGRYIVQKGYETVKINLQFKYNNSQNDVDLLDDLLCREYPFYVWLCGGEYEAFAVELRGWRLQDMYLVQVDKDYFNGYYKDIWTAGATSKISLVEAIDDRIPESII